jgi:hypothetical protein
MKDCRRGRRVRDKDKKELKVDNFGLEQGKNKNSARVKTPVFSSSAIPSRRQLCTNVEG